MAAGCRSTAPSPTNGRRCRCCLARPTVSKVCAPFWTSAFPSSRVVDMRTLVVGGGTMGAGIAQVLLEAGAAVTLSESSEDYAASARQRVVDGLQRAKADVGDVLPRLSVTIGLDAPLDVQLVVEAVPEDPELKARVLADIEEAVPDDAVIASNTSSLSINDMASGLRHPERFVGMHFFNPVPRSALVEIV